MNTRDLTKFGYREKDIAADLLKALSNGEADFLGDGTTVEFNPNSGMVFLVDDDLNVGILNNGELVQFFSCPNCGNEGTNEDYPFNEHEGYCSETCQKENE